MHKVSNSVRAPAGLEWSIFKKLPQLTCGAAVLLLVLRFLFGLSIDSDSKIDLESTMDSQRLDYIFYGLGLTTMLLIVFITFLCIFVLIAKGPEYRADSYHVNDSDAP